MTGALRAWLEYLGDKWKGREPHIDRHVRPPVLSAGCGEGSRLDRTDPPIIGLDINFNNARQAARTGPVICGSVARIPAENRSFRTVLALQLVEHLEPRQLADFLWEANRVLVPGGRLIVSSPLEPYVWDRLSHVRPYPPKALRTFLTRERFRENYPSPVGLEEQFVFYYGPRTTFRGIPLYPLSPLTNLLSNLTKLGRSGYVAGFEKTATGDGRTREAGEL